MSKKGVSYRKLPEPGGNPRAVAQVVNLLLDGKMNVKGSLTLTQNAGSTTVTDYRVGTNSAILLMPKTANASAAITSTYVEAVGQNEFTLSHSNNAQDDRNFDYVVLG